MKSYEQIYEAHDSEGDYLRVVTKPDCHLEVSASWGSEGTLIELNREQAIRLKESLNSWYESI